MKPEYKELLETARMKYDSGEHEVAESILNQLIMANYASADVFHLVGCLSYGKGKVKKAVKSFRRALEIDPKHTDAALGLSMVLNDTGKYEEAAKVYESGIGSEKMRQEKRNHPLVEDKIARRLKELGDLYLQIEKVDEAIKYYFEAYKMSSPADKMIIRMQVISCYIKKGEKQKAVAELKRIIKDRPYYSEARIVLGEIFYAMNRTLDAVEQWESVLLRDPDNPKVKKLLAKAQDKGTTVLA